MQLHSSARIDHTMITDFSQRWTREKTVFIPPTERVNTTRLDVAEISEIEAKTFVTTYHYSRSYPAARRRFGLYDNGELVGAAIFSHPVNDRSITNVFKCDRGSDGLELGRFILLDQVPFNGESWFLARCREILKNDYVGFIAFADDVAREDAAGEIVFRGHLGTIYKAFNASFLGRGTAMTLQILPDGSVLNKRAISKIRNGESGWIYAAGQLETFGAPVCPADPEKRRSWLRQWMPRITRNVRHAGNLKYAWSFSDKVRLDTLPYPRLRFADLQQKLSFPTLETL